MTIYQPVLPISSLLQSQGIRLATQEDVADVTQMIMQSVDQGRLVVLWIDCFYESIRSDTYHRVHHPHTLLFYGYNRKKRKFNIIEHQHLDSPTYEKQEISFNDVENAYEGFLHYFHDSQPQTYYEFLGEPDWVEWQDKDFVETFRHNSLLQKSLLRNGIQALRSFQADFEPLVEDQIMLHQNAEKLIISLSEVIKSKQVELYKIEHLSIDQQKSDMLKQIVNGWISLRSVIAKFQYSGRYSEKVVSASRAHLAQVVAYEALYIE